MINFFRFKDNVLFDTQTNLKYKSTQTRVFKNIQIKLVISKITNDDAGKYKFQLELQNQLIAESAEGTLTVIKVIILNSYIIFINFFQKEEKSRKLTTVKNNNESKQKQDNNNGNNENNNKKTGNKNIKINNNKDENNNIKINNNINNNNNKDYNNNNIENNKENNNTNKSDSKINQNLNKIVLDENQNNIFELNRNLLKNKENLLKTQQPMDFSCVEASVDIDDDELDKFLETKKVNIFFNLNLKKLQNLNMNTTKFYNTINNDLIENNKNNIRRRSSSSSCSKKLQKGIAPNFIVGLKDMDMEIGDSAAFAGKTIINKSKNINKIKNQFLQKNLGIYMNVKMQKL